LKRRFTHAMFASGLQSGIVMASQPKIRVSKSRPRAPAGKRQVLIIMDQEVAKSVKVAAVEDDIKMSHAVEEAVREWLMKRKRERATRSAV
jgi:hypothetical protein